MHGRLLAATAAALITLALPAAASAATFTVGNENDAGAGSLRQAIADANANGNPAERDVIHFGPGVDGIVLVAALPEVGEPVTLLGPVGIDLGGNGGLRMRSGTAVSSQILGVALTNASDTALHVEDAEFLVQGSTLDGVRLGSGATGSVGGDPAKPNTIAASGVDGVRVEAGADVQVAHNTITATGAGVRVQSPAAGVFANAITGGAAGGLVLEACAPAQVVTRNNIGGTGDGVVLAASGCQIGGSGEDDGNTISGAAGAGVRSAGNGGDIVGNTITGNGVGVAISGSGGRVIGNVISGNAGSGVRLQDAFALIRGNSISGNGGLGIDHGVEGPDAIPASITAAERENGKLRVRGTVVTPGPGTYELEFSANAACDPSGFGEGAAPLAPVALLAGVAPGGNTPFSVLIDADLPVGTIVTVTATLGGANTGEYSKCATVAQPAPPGPGPDREPEPAATLDAPRGTVKAGRVKRITGSATGAESVQVAVTRKQGRRCRTLRPSGRLTRPAARRACSRPRWLGATGTDPWTLTLKRGLPPGTYVIRVRAIAPDGTVQSPPAKTTVRLRR